MAMAKLIAFVTLYTAAMAVSYTGLIFGWGLSPQSWPTIIGCTFGSMILMTAAGGIVKS